MAGYNEVLKKHRLEIPSIPTILPIKKHKKIMQFKKKFFVSYFKIARFKMVATTQNSYFTVSKYRNGYSN